MARLSFLVVTLGLLLGPSALPREVNPEQPLPEHDQKLVRAFPDDERVLAMPIQLFLRSKGLVLAAKEFSIEPDGRIKLTPCRIAQFDKEHPNRAPKRFQSDWVLIEFDRHPKSITDIANRKMVALELADGSKHVLMK